MSDDFILLEVVYEDDNLIAINKPHGLLVHRSKIAKDAKMFALQLLRDQIGQRVYPIHRLDRKTSGVLLFAKNKEAHVAIQQLFAERKVTKIYWAIVRGYVFADGVIDYALTHEGKSSEAVTPYRVKDRFEIDLPYGKFQTSRYSFLEMMPSTGRFHQIRKHMAHFRHPILGDRPHGCNKQNRLWKNSFNMEKMMLHALSINFKWKDQHYQIQATISDEFTRVLDILRDNKGGLIR